MTLQELIMDHRKKCNSGVCIDGLYFWCKKDQMDCIDIIRLREAYALGQKERQPEIDDLLKKLQENNITGYFEE